MKTMTTSVFSILLALLLLGCAPAGDEQKQSDGTLKVVTTIGMISDVTENVGGEHVTVEGLMGPGVDPHLYKASAGDVRELQSADIIFYNGLHLEAQMGEVLEQMNRTKTTVAVTKTIPEEELLGDPAYPGQHDPHVWFDVTKWIEATEVIRDALMEEDPEHAEDYQQNADAYLAQLEELHGYVEEQAATVPEEQRVLVTAHDAFNYFGQRYGFDVRGLQGISTQSEAGTRDVQDLADFIAERKIKAIFVESSVPKRNVEAVQAAVQSRGWDVKIGGELFSDAMGDAGTVEGTYVGMVEHNIDTIAGALR